VANDHKLPDIRADVIKKAREAKGISIPKMSKDLCFSVKQIEQIECGERSHFYSLAIKVSATKRVADYLGLNYEEVFDFGPDLVQDIQSSEEPIQSEQTNLPEPQSIPAVPPVPPVVEKMPERLERFDPPAEEKEVCALLVEGLMNKEIAERLGTTDATIKVHKARVMEKMRASSLQDLVRYHLELN